jgi:glycosyltransferase involved in cell wall biosynthesis
MTRRTRRIAMVAYTHYQTDPRCRREAELCVEAGWEVDFYALRRSGGGDVDLRGVRLLELGMDRYRGGSAAAYILSYVEFLLRAMVALARGHQRRRYDVVHVNTMPDFMVLAALWPRLRGARVVLDIHDVMPEIYMTKFRLPANHWKIRLIRAVEVWSTRMAHRVLTAEHPKAELLAEHGVAPDRIRVLLNLPDNRIFPRRHPVDDAPAGPDDRAFRLVYHGTVAHRLGLDLAIGALIELRGRCPEATLRIIGDGDHLPELHRLTDELGLNDRVDFSDAFVPIETIVPELAEAHLAVIPTRFEISTDYMLPTKLIEYLRLGVPALFTPTRTIRWYFGDECVFYLDDPTPAAIADKIAWVRDNMAEARALTAELQENFFARYDWERHKQAYLDMLDELVG